MNSSDTSIGNQRDAIDCTETQTTLKNVFHTLRHRDLSVVCFSAIANSHHTLTALEQSLSFESPLIL